MRLSEIKGEKAIEVAADLLEQIEKLIKDPKFSKEAHKSYMSAVRYSMKAHPKIMIRILAILDQEDPKTYEVNLLTLPKKIAEIASDPELQDLFTWQSQAASGSATETTEASES
jgi:hypothetical protein